MDYSEQIIYWIEESLETLDSAKILFEKSKYLESAFFCNLACEKMLKAIYVHNTKDIPPKVHTLIKLAQLAGIYDGLSEDYKRFLNRIEVFQIEGRYPENRKKLYETTPKQVFFDIIQKTEEVVAWLKEQMK